MYDRNGRDRSGSNIVEDFLAPTNNSSNLSGWWSVSQKQLCFTGQLGTIHMLDRKVIAEQEAPGMLLRSTDQRS